jgi:hypothetical protein
MEFIHIADTPQIDQKPASHGHNSNTPQALTAFGKTLSIPLTQLALGLESEPHPSHLNA